MGSFCDTESRERKEVAPGVWIRTFWSERMLLAIVEVRAHAVIPAHSHPAEQAGTVISGMITLTIDGETRTLGAGGAYLIPGGVEHSAIGLDMPALVCDVFSPAREDYRY
jgi:quercetin dioxygenase-like cupin family protein